MADRDRKPRRVRSRRARPLASGSLTLAAIGAMLSVFGIADLIQALVERIELKPPETGPSDVPRVN